jgi:hypothetical protein
VSGVLEWGRFDEFLMEYGATFTLLGQLWGKDWFIGEHPEMYPDLFMRQIPRADDPLVFFNSRTISRPITTYGLAQTFPIDDVDEDGNAVPLDEDWVEPNVDEIYAVVKLYNYWLSDRAFATRTSNVVKFRAG